MRDKNDAMHVSMSLRVSHTQCVRVENPVIYFITLHKEMYYTTSCLILIHMYFNCILYLRIHLTQGNTDLILRFRVHVHE